MEKQVKSSSFDIVEENGKLNENCKESWESRVQNKKND
jgi:hypothetical protein